MYINRKESEILGTKIASRESVWAPHIHLFKFHSNSLLHKHLNSLPPNLDNRHSSHIHTTYLKQNNTHPFTHTHSHFKLEKEKREERTESEGRERRREKRKRGPREKRGEEKESEGEGILERDLRRGESLILCSTCWSWVWKVGWSKRFVGDGSSSSQTLFLSLMHCV